MKATILTRTCVTKVLTFGAGVQWFEAYAAAQQHNRVVVGGISLRGSVGAAGGWLQGGGHSPLSPTYGLGTHKHPPMAILNLSRLFVQALTTFWK